MAITLSDISVALDPASAVDTASTSDSNWCNVVSPANASVADSCATSDAVTVRITLPSSVSVPFLIAASFAVAVLYDTATADTGTTADAVTIAQEIRNADTAATAESVGISLTVPVVDGAATADAVGAVAGIYSSAEDAASTSDEAVGAVDLYTTATDAASTSDSVAIEEVAPDAVAVTDSASTSDSNSTTFAIGHADGATTTDAAVGILGAYSSAVDGATTEDFHTVSISAGAPVDAHPIAARAEAVRVGVLASELGVGSFADRVLVGVLNGSPIMRIGRCYQGCDFPIFFPKAKDATGAAIDLTGATLVCYALIGSTPVAATSTSIDATAGTSQAIFPAALTAGWTAGTTVQYDGIITLENGHKHVIGTGYFTVMDPVSIP